MTGRRAPRPAEHYVHGLHGPIAVVNGRVCALLERYVGFDQLRSSVRGADAEVDAVFMAMHLAATAWRRSVTGTTVAASPEQPPESQWLSTPQAAALAGLKTDRGIRQAIKRGALKAENVAGRWRISREELNYWRSAREERR